jgi:hypothetical protein
MFLNPLLWLTQIGFDIRPPFVPRVLESSSLMPADHNRQQNQSHPFASPLSPRNRLVTNFTTPSPTNKAHHQRLALACSKARNQKWLMLTLIGFIFIFRPPYSPLLFVLSASLMPADHNETGHLPEPFPKATSRGINHDAHVPDA